MCGCHTIQCSSSSNLIIFYQLHFIRSHQPAVPSLSPTKSNNSCLAGTNFPPCRENQCDLKFLMKKATSTLSLVRTSFTFGLADNTIVIAYISVNSTSLVFNSKWQLPHWLWCFSSHPLLPDLSLHLYDFLLLQYFNHYHAFNT